MNKTTTEKKLTHELDMDRLVNQDSSFFKGLINKIHGYENVFTNEMGGSTQNQTSTIGGSAGQNWSQRGPSTITDAGWRGPSSTSMRGGVGPSSRFGSSNESMSLSEMMRNVGTDVRNWGGWSPAMQRIQQMLGGAAGALGPMAYGGPLQATGQVGGAQANLAALLAQKPYTAQRIDQNVINPIMDAVNMNAAQMGRFGSGAHQGHVAATLAPVMQQELARVDALNSQLRGQQMAAIPALMQMEAGQLANQRERNQWGQAEGQRAFMRQMDLYKQLAGIGGQSRGQTTQDMNRKLQQETERRFREQESGREHWSDQQRSAEQWGNTREDSGFRQDGGWSDQGRTNTSLTENSGRTDKQTQTFGERLSEALEWGQSESSTEENLEQTFKGWEKMTVEQKKSLLGKIFGAIGSLAGAATGIGSIGGSIGGILAKFAKKKDGDG